MARKRLATDEIATRLADKLTEREKNITQFFEGVEDPHPTGTGGKWKALDFVPTEFVKKIIRENSQDQLADDENLDPINWDYAAKRLLEICTSQLDRGGIATRYDCVHVKTGNLFTVTVIQMQNADYSSYRGTTIHIADGCISLKTGLQNQTSQYPVTDVRQRTTLIVGSMFLTDECENSSHVYVLLTDSDEIESLKSVLQRFRNFRENPVKWGDVSEDVRTRLITNLNAKLQSQPIQINTDVLQNLEGSQLNQFLQSGTLQICSKKLEFGECPYVSRWLTSSSMITTDNELKEHTTYIVFNAEEDDIPRIKEQLKGHVFFTEDIEDLTYLPVYRQIPVTREIDCNVVVKHLKSLREAEQHTGPHHIQILKFDQYPLFRVIPDNEVTQQWSRLMVMVAQPGEGKTSVLQHIFKTCSTPVCHFTDTKLVSKFSPSSIDDFTVEHVRAVITNKIVTTYLDRVVLEPIFDTFHIVVLIDTGSNEEDSQLYKIVKVMVKLTNLSIVLTTRNSSTADHMRGLHESFINLKLMCLSHNDKLDLICKPMFSNALGKYILNFYESKFAKMPTRIWTAVTEVYKKYLEENRYNSTPCSIPFNITVAEIYDMFIELSYQSFKKKNPEFEGNLSIYQEFHILYAIKKVVPDFLPIAQSALDQHKNSFKTDLSCIDCLSFREYFVDLFILNVLSGTTHCDMEWDNSFRDLFKQRYIRAGKPANHLNDILGYTKLSRVSRLEFNKFDIVQVVMLCKSQPNIARVLFDLSRRSLEKDGFNNWCNNERLLRVNIPGVLRFLHLKPQTNFTVPEILLILSAHLGFSNLFRYIIAKNKEKVDMHDIKIRERQSFRSLLHLVMYHSRDNDQTTLLDKTLIIRLLLQKSPKMHKLRDYYGNTPILEKNVHFEHVKQLVQEGARLEDTDFTGRNLLDKNADNPALIEKIKLEFPKVFHKLNLSLRLRSKLPVSRPYDKNARFRYDISPDLVKKFLSGTTVDDKDKLTLNEVAAYVESSLQYGSHEEFQSLLLQDILKTNQMEFKHTELCNLLNTRLKEGLFSLQVSPQFEVIMCRSDSPFMVACINGYQAIATLLGESFGAKWIENLKDFELSFLFEGLNKYHSEDLILSVTNRLKESNFAVPYYPVQEALCSGHLKLFQIYRENLKFRERKWSQFGRKKGFGILHHLLENSMHDSKEVLERKESLIRYIFTISRESVNVRDKHGRSAILLGTAHYQLVRFLIKNTDINVKTSDREDNNILNVCLGNIIKLSEYLGESAYDANFCRHDQVIYLAKLVDINDLANKQIKWIMARTQKLVKIKTKALLAAKFKLKNNPTFTGSTTMSITEDAQLLALPDMSESEDEMESSHVASSSRGWKKDLLHEKTIMRLDDELDHDKDLVKVDEPFTSKRKYGYLDSDDSMTGLLFDFDDDSSDDFETQYMEPLDREESKSHQTCKKRSKRDRFRTKSDSVEPGNLGDQPTAGSSSSTSSQQLMELAKEKTNTTEYVKTETEQGMSAPRVVKNVEKCSGKEEKEGVSSSTDPKLDK